MIVESIAREVVLPPDEAGIIKARLAEGQDNIKRIDAAKTEAALEEAARWQGEIDTLMGRAAHPERAVEYIDLDTGRVVDPLMVDGLPRTPAGAIATPLNFSKGTNEEIAQLLSRRTELMMEIADLVDSKPETADQAAEAQYQLGQLKIELDLKMIRLYALLTANPNITENWLMQNAGSWNPSDLIVLINRYQQRGNMVMAEIRKFRHKPVRR